MISVLGAEERSSVEIEAFLAASESVRFAGPRRLPSHSEVCGPVNRSACYSNAKDADAMALEGGDGIRGGAFVGNQNIDLVSRADNGGVHLSQLA